MTTKALYFRNMIKSSSDEMNTIQLLTTSQQILTWEFLQQLGLTFPLQ